MEQACFYVSIARHTLRICHRYPYIRTLCDGYLISGQDETTVKAEIAVTEADISAEIERMGHTISAPYAEALALERVAARALASLGVIHMHAVALAVDGEGYIFLADSGEGKSTHMRHWLNHLGDRAVVVADDKPFFSCVDDTLTVFGSPFCGKERWGRNLAVPVRSFCILRRAPEDTIRVASFREALQEFFLRVFLPEDPASAVAVLNVADRVLPHIPFWCLGCTDSPHAAEVACTAMLERK